MNFKQSDVLAVAFDVKKVKETTSKMSHKLPSVYRIQLTGNIHLVLFQVRRKAKSQQSKLCEILL